MIRITARGGWLLAILALAGCGGSSNDAPALAATATDVPAPCQAAFRTNTASQQDNLLASVAPAVVLSSCKLDASRNVTIGARTAVVPRW